MTLVVKKTFRSTLAALVCGAVALVGCSTDSVSTNTTDQELREKISNSGELPNPRDLEGVDEVKDFGEPVPVAENPNPTLPVELTDADGYEVTVTDISVESPISPPPITHSVAPQALIPSTMPWAKPSIQP